MKFKGKEIKEVTKQVANESAIKKIGVRCTNVEAHNILDFVDKNDEYQVLFRPSHKEGFKYYVYFNRVDGKEN